MRQFKLLCTLPKDGDWMFGVVSIQGAPDVVLVLDRLGRHPPRMIATDGKVTEIRDVS